MLAYALAALMSVVPSHSLSPAPDPAAGALLIVAPAAFHASLKPFVEHKRLKRPTTLISLEDVLKTSDGIDDPERLKHAIFDAWKKDAVRYVLLVGDADVMPVRYMVLDRNTPAAFDYAFYPSDLYYADVAKPDGSFDDWNGMKDGFHAGYIGEVRGEKNKSDPINYDSISYTPEIGLGRWPVGTPDEVKTVADKTIRYEKSASSPAQDKPRPMAAIFMVAGWVDAREQMNKVGSTLERNDVWAVERRFYKDAGAKWDTKPPDEENAVSLLNSGARLVLHSGHGSDDTWEGCFSTRSLSRVKNADAPPVMMSAGCSTARLATLPPYEAYTDINGKDHAGTNVGEVFTEPPPAPSPYQRGKFNLTGLGERLLRDGPDGAVAYIGCNTGSQPCGLTLLEGFAEGVAAKRGATLGDCWIHAITHYHKHEELATITPTESWYPASIFFQGMKFMVYGDPTIEIGR